MAALWRRNSIGADIVSPSIPFNREFRSANEPAYVRDALARGLAGPGHYTACCEKWLEARLGAPRVLLVQSCTSALEISALLCGGMGRGRGEVLVPGFTYASGPAAFALHGYRPVFVDIRPETGNMAAEAIEECITPESRVLVPTHYAGVPDSIDECRKAAARHGLILVEDAAQALDSSFAGQSAGTIGSLGAVSFHSTKNVSCGEGGALIVNDPELIARAEILREKGTDRRLFLRGERDRYTWLESSGSHVMSELQAAVLLARLESLDEITRTRRAHCDWYTAALRPYAEAGRIVLRPPPAVECVGNGHTVFLLLPDRSTRDDFIDFARTRGIGAAFHYIALHQTPKGREWAPVGRRLVGVEEAADRLVRLPVYPSLTVEERSVVVDTVGEFIDSRAVACDIS